MVAIVKTGHSIRRTFLYNENKVKEGVAELIDTQNYPMDASKMTEAHRLGMLLKLASRNEYVKRNSVHISLNFAPGEQLDHEKMCLIAADYMNGIGFGNQPYLVYQHHDAGHPHLHIVTVKIDHKGKRIETQNIGRIQSEKARKEIEIKYGLVQAEKHKRAFFKLNPLSTESAEKAVYGKWETKRAISSVLSYLLTAYKYTSLAELNAVLNQYNIHADEGSEHSRIRKNKGLQYRIIGENNQPVGNAVKASLLHNNPGLKYLQKRFLLNQNLRQKDKSRLCREIDLALLGLSRPTLSSLAAALRKTGIQVVYRKSKEGRLYGITYVDHKSKSVFNGSALGKSYSANAITDRCFPELVNPLHHSAAGEKHLLDIPPIWQCGAALTHPFALKASPASAANLIEAFLAPVQTTSYLPPELRRKRKKRRRKQTNT